MEVSCQLHNPGCFNPGAHWIGGWVDSRIDMDAMAKENSLPLPGIEPRSSNLFSMKTELSELMLCKCSNPRIP